MDNIDSGVPEDFNHALAADPEPEEPGPTAAPTGSQSIVDKVGQDYQLYLTNEKSSQNQNIMEKHLLKINEMAMVCVAENIKYITINTKEQ